MELTQLRQDIDKIDDELVSLFCQRMEVAAKIADCKRESGTPIYVPAREWPTTPGCCTPCFSS